MADKIAKFFERGLRDVWTREWDNANNDYYTPDHKEGEAEGTYLPGDVVKWNGHTQVEVSFSQEETALASGDDPYWAILHGALTGDITLTFYDMDIEQFCKLMNVGYDADYGLIAGGDNEPKYVGLMFSVTCNDGSVNHYVFPKCVFRMADMTHQTISDEENAVSEISIPGKVCPIFTDSEDFPRVTFIELNSTKSNAFSKYADTIVKPFSK